MGVLMKLADILQKKKSSALTSAILALVVVFGVFNRITFPAFLIIPGLRLVPHFIKKYALAPLYTSRSLQT
jgi:hypothetical protein